MSKRFLRKEDVSLENNFNYMESIRQIQQLNLLGNKFLECGDNNKAGECFFKSLQIEYIVNTNLSMYFAVSGDSVVAAEYCQENLDILNVLTEWTEGKLEENTAALGDVEISGSMAECA